ncbi:hypothetical protein [Bacillus inaquosorum]|uniref:hypothetical protein n=1 Tax=Bacillus inaquosorum TaxID=483913 RepID=UPI002282709A|nr:hypothetical protein [Bacillus inaquosorum]MCY8073363.1 hypothetical protein [Bacillus inaquosorum]MCY9380822.1 hypothetical protein [Bacillus inaquosorum]
MQNYKELNSSNKAVDYIVNYFKENWVKLDRDGKPDYIDIIPINDKKIEFHWGSKYLYLEYPSEKTLYISLFGSASFPVQYRIKVSFSNHGGKINSIISIDELKLDDTKGTKHYLNREYIDKVFNYAFS